MIKSGLNVNAKNVLSQTALHLAVKKHSVPIIEDLLKKGADINAQSVLGTPLHYAVKQSLTKGHTRILRKLIKHGANVDAVDEKGLTALAAGEEFYNELCKGRYTSAPVSADELEKYKNAMEAIRAAFNANYLVKNTYGSNSSLLYQPEKSLDENKITKECYVPSP